MTTMRRSSGAQAGLAAEVAEGAVGAQERLLGHVLGLGAAAEHAQRHAEHAMLVGGHQLLEGARVAGAQPGQQGGILGTSLTHR
jgi:hypothetical protein